MEIYTAKKEIDRVLRENAAKFPEELKVITNITYEDREFNPCEYESKELAYVDGELVIDIEGVPEEGAIGFSLFAEFHKGVVKDEDDFVAQLAVFSSEVDEFINQYITAEDKAAFIDKKVKNNIDETARAKEELNKELKMISRRLSIAIGIAIGILVFGIIISLFL